MNPTRHFFRNSCQECSRNYFKDTFRNLSLGDFSSISSWDLFSNCFWEPLKNSWRIVMGNFLRNSSKIFWMILPKTSECLAHAQQEFLKKKKISSEFPNPRKFLDEDITASKYEEISVESSARVYGGISTVIAGRITPTIFTGFLGSLHEFF